MRVCGTCSLCGGSVTVPTIWLGIFPPAPSCTSCKAVPVEAHGPVIPMQKKPETSNRMSRWMKNS